MTARPPVPIEHVEAVPHRVVAGLWCPACALPSVVHVVFSIVWLTATGVGSRLASRAVCSDCRRTVDVIPARQDGPMGDVTPSGDAVPVNDCTTPGEA